MAPAKRVRSGPLSPPAMIAAWNSSGSPVGLADPRSSARASRNAASPGSWTWTKSRLIAASSPPMPSASMCTGEAHGLTTSSATRWRASAALRSASPVTATARSSSRLSRTSAPSSACPTLTSIGYGDSASGGGAGTSSTAICHASPSPVHGPGSSAGSASVSTIRLGESRTETRRGAGLRPRSAASSSSIGWAVAEPVTCTDFSTARSSSGGGAMIRAGPAIAQLGPPVLPQHQPERAGQERSRAGQSREQPARGDLVLGSFGLGLLRRRIGYFGSGRCDLRRGESSRGLVGSWTCFGFVRLGRIRLSRDGELPAGQDQVRVGEVGAVRPERCRAMPRRSTGRRRRRRVRPRRSRRGCRPAARRTRRPVRVSAIGTLRTVPGSRKSGRPSRTASLRSTSSTYRVPSPSRSSAIFQRLSPRLTV